VAPTSATVCPGGHGKRHVLQRVLRRIARSVAKRDVLEADLATDARQLDRARPVGQVGRLVEQLEDLVERGHAGLIGRVDLRELADRVEEPVERRDEAHEHADLDVAVDRLAPRR
jgi:hypothetical protein